MPSVHTIHFDNHVRYAAVHVCQHCACESFAVYKLHVFCFQEVQTIHVFFVERYQHCALRFFAPHNGFKEITAAFLDELTDGVQVSGEVCCHREDTFAVFAFAFCVKLFIPFAERNHVRFIVCQNFHCFAVTVEEVSCCRILIAGVFHDVRVAVSLSCPLCAFHNFVDVYACHCHSQHAYCCQNSESAADIIGDHECFIAFCVAHGFQCASGSVCCRVNTFCCAFFAIFCFQQLFEDTESDGGFCGSTGFGDDVYREISVTQNTQNVTQVSGADVIAHEIDVGGCFLFVFVVKRCFDEVQSGSGAQIRAADTDNDQYFTLFLDFFRCFFDTGKFFLIVIHRPIYPTYEIVAFACFFMKRCVACFHFFCHCGKVLFCHSIAFD
ncbi:uncharacterized protein BN684_00836 [Clostridium sp. CAG:505]|nr:uncharacterized protein BN684_00836 [Clostridium sp. CAG:505]